MKKYQIRLLIALLCGFLFSSVLFLSPCFSSEGDKLWNPDAVPVTQASGYQDHARTVSDGNGGAIIVWKDGRYSTDDIFAQRLDADGTPLWTIDGVPVAIGFDEQVDPEITADGSGGAVVTWYSHSYTSTWGVYAQRIDSNGTRQWGAEGIQLNSSAVINPSSSPADLVIATDGSGGAFIVFQASTGVRCVHVLDNGTLVSPGIGGIGLSGGEIQEGGLAIIDDGAGGALVAMADGYSVNVQRVTSNLGLPWGTVPVDVNCDPRGATNPAIVADGSHGTFITWVRKGTSETQVLIQHLDSGGNAVWPLGGVVLVDSTDVGENTAWFSNHIIPAVTSDGLGGALVVWNDWRNEPDPFGQNDDIYAQRIDGTGAPLWADGGISVWYWDEGSQRNPKIAGTAAGGSLVVFQDMGMGSWDIIAVKLNPDGSKWPVSQSYVYYDGPPPTTIDQTDPQVVFDGSGPSATGAVVAWVDEPGSYPDIYAQKIEVQMAPRPDIVVDAIIFDPPSPGPNEPFTVEVSARNQGNAATGGFHMKLCYDAVPFGVCDYCIYPLGLGPGNTGGCYIDFSNGLAVGEYDFTATVDSTYVVYESDETNNTKNASLVVTSPDTDPPQPDPMTWAIPPHGISTTAIAMTATGATDASPPVDYLFACMTAGCHPAGWQTGTSYTDTGLQPNAWYGWRVKARDSLDNETAWSLTNYDYTDIETPAGVVFDFDDVGSTYIKVKVPNTLSNLDVGLSGLIIYNITKGTASGWKQNNDWWQSSGLTPNTSYSFRAKAKNGSGRETPLTAYYFRRSRAAQPGTGSFSNVTSSSIQVNWTANGNPPGTEYFCINMVSGADSGWTTATSWIDTGLDCHTTYNYQVRARNAEGWGTDWTDLGSQETLECANVCKADFGFDGDVDGGDLYTFLQNFGQPCFTHGGCKGDFDGDGDVDDLDLKIFAKEYGRADCSTEP